MKATADPERGRIDEQSRDEAPLSREVHMHRIKIEQASRRRINRLVRGLFCGEHDAIGNAAKCPGKAGERGNLPRAEDHPDHFGGQRLRGFDVDPHHADRRGGGEGDGAAALAVRDRTHDARGPSWRTIRVPEHGAQIAKAGEQVTSKKSSSGELTSAGVDGSCNCVPLLGMKRVGIYEARIDLGQVYCFG